MAQGTGYTYSQRGDVVLATRTGTTRNQPSNYKPFKLLKGVDTVITFFIKDVNGWPVKVRDPSKKQKTSEAVTKDNLTTGVNGQLRYRVSEANLYRGSARFGPAGGDRGERRRSAARPPFASPPHQGVEFPPPEALGEAGPGLLGT